MRISLLTLFAIGVLAQTLSAQHLEYISPVPGSHAAPPSTIIVVRSSHNVTAAGDVLRRAVHVIGEGERVIDVMVRLAADSKTLNILPITPLRASETITVSLQKGLGLPDTSFSFTTVRVPVLRASQGGLSDADIVKRDAELQAEPLPADFPPITVTTNSGATPLDLFIAPNSRVTPEKYGRFSMALDTAGAARSFKRLNYWPFDFKVLPNGLMSISRFPASAGVTTEASLYVMDSTWAVVDSIEARNGYLTTSHDHMVLPNGHIVVLASEDVVIDMSKVVDGGNPAASVVQGIIQELDQDRNVVFQWRTLEYIPVTDSYEDLKAASIRYVHNNSLWVDHEGDFLISLRHCSAVIRIDRATGDVKWIMGGKRNQFTFTSAVSGVTDPMFSYQHDVRRTKSGITMFDNGNFRNPQYSRAVEYRIDEVNKTAALIWTYRHSPDAFTNLQGGVQTLSNGHRVIAWGSASSNGHPGVTEVDSNGVVVFEATLPKELFVYRAQRHLWPPGKPSDTVFKDEVLPLNTYEYSDGNDTVGIWVTFTEFNSAFYNATKGKRFPYSPVNPRFDGIAPNVYPIRIWLEQEGITDSRLEVRFDLDVIGLPGTSGYEVYHRPVIGSGAFTKEVTQFTPDRRTLVVANTDFGEFLIADALSAPTSILAPFAVSPINNEKRRATVAQTLRVAPRGAFDSVQIQVATDSLFAQVVGDFTTRADKASMATNVDAPGFRYWRTRSFYRGQTSEWSSTHVFELSAPFLTLNLPLNKFITFIDKTAPILWQTNVSGLGRIDLLKGNEVILIKDSVKLQNQGYLWKVPLNTPVGTGYAIRITAYSDPLSDQSDTIVEVQLGTSVADFITPAQRIAVSPLPASGVVTLTGDALLQVSQILVFAVDGSLVYSASGNGSAEQTIDVEDFAPGTYHCVLVSNLRAVTVPVVITR